MAGLAVVEKQENRAPVAAHDNLTWTVNKKFREGDTFEAAGHVMRVESLLEFLPTHNVAAVSVVEKQSAKSPALRFSGVFNEETRQAVNVWWGPKPK